MSLLKRSGVVGGLVAMAVLALAAPASAHVTVNPSTAAQGGYAKVTFRVPNEMDSANTTKVEVNLPADTPFAYVGLKQVTGWTAVAQKAKLAKPIDSHGTQLTEAVNKITWTASAPAVVKPGEFQEFDVSLGPLPEVDQIVFKALQTYSDGTVVRWIDEPTTDGTEPEHPAPVLKLTPAAAADTAVAASAPAATGQAAAPAKGDGNGTWAGIIGIVLGLAGLVLGLLAYRRAAQSTPAAAAAPAAPAGTE
ncbi:YcnI family protein [Actinoplanes sp. N902-109]|uniref:YcnI family protein n=1 Tax=Actinoplanes sp. (strain N902-109) TaxID=649831 RepID=UPI0003295BFB|nr:YcnI family protein [Actinoplanes sp. N902-109]AGL18073.1 nuclear export factor GLE1 [Actinoplanes sp. N902-109]